MSLRAPQAQRQKRAAEEQAEEFRVRINELQTINVNLTSVKSKLEQELGNLTADYDEVTKELKVSDTGSPEVKLSGEVKGQG